MKRNYVRPLMVGEKFVANEYVAACGGTEYGLYKFKCDAGTYDNYNTVYYETNNESGLQTDGRRPDYRKTFLYHPCDKTHEAPVYDEFIDGYCITPSGETISVVIWTEKGTNVHCTKALNRDQWETVKS